MIALVLAAAAVSPSPASSSAAEKTWTACIDRTTTNYDWGQCGTRYIAQEDAALNRSWQKLMAVTSGKTKTDLIAEERAWIGYRKTACAFYANGDWGREGQVLHYAGCVAGVIRHRTNELSDYLEFVGTK